MNKSNVGFIGAGVMGAPMAANLASAGYNLTLFDVNYQAAHDAAASFSNMSVADSPKEAAKISDVVITMLPSGRYVQKAVFGDSGMIEGFNEGSLLIDTSSSEPWLTIETANALKDKGVQMVDAPVSGAQAGAQAAELVFMIGGEQDAVERAIPILEALGRQTYHLGPVGSGHAMKCINNLITAMTFMSTIEGLTIGKQFGLDPNVMTDVLNVSTGMSWISQTHIKQRIISRKFDDQFKLSLMVKDIGIATAMANEMNIPLPCSSLGHQLWKAADRYAGEGSSISEMARWVEHVTGVEITDK
ncbi:MAG: NAD(P)-dependent oxidoreductase [Desulfobacteraceae bacterium]|nr:NAD(P)-dependent oxidoreductase [Desulfobacteraceae bacterium]